MSNENIALGACRVLMMQGVFDITKAVDVGYTTGGSTGTIQTDYDETIYDSFGVIVVSRRVNKTSADISFTILDMSAANIAMINASRQAEGSAPTNWGIAFVPINKKLPVVLFPQANITQMAIQMKSDSEGSVVITGKTAPTASSADVYQLIAQS